MKFLYLFLFSGFTLAFQWPDFSVRREKASSFSIQTKWVVDTVKDRSLSRRLWNNSPPLVTESLVVQGNAVDGVRAYDKDKGTELWSFDLPSGTASPLVLHQGDLYFGGADGFFYSLKLKTGRLNWKFWTASENSGAPLIHKDSVYWTANNQKLYALNLQGKLLWIYSGPSLPKTFVARGRPRPAVYKNSVYMAFYDGTLRALNKKTGKLKWKKSLSSKPVTEGLEINGSCLLAPVFDAHLFCLNPLDGRVRWKVPGGASALLSDKRTLYYWNKRELYAVKRQSVKRLWKRKLKEKGWPLPPVLFKKHLVYGFSSLGKLVFTDIRNGKLRGEYRFGKGLAAPVSVDLKNNHIYFISVEGYLHKLSVL